ncbi:MAG: nucleotidyltransferase domain-containing protein [Deltaproteobacteria bacterium]|nr:nucleotidyltransferase domain-containing protein [Deltaproteobacteria bacterium]
MVRREPLPRDIRDRLPALVATFRGRPEVAALYLFGSFAAGMEDSLSDLDLAFLLVDEATAKAEVEEAADLYLTEIQSLLGTEEISLVALDSAPLTLRYEVVSKGRVLVENDPSRRLAFEVLTEDLFMDFAPLLDAYDDELLRQLSAVTG